ncbi:MAG TPA: hypothetical protein VF944_11945 [Candidatus Bathyarchaeia archaeon]
MTRNGSDYLLRSVLEIRTGDAGSRTGPSRVRPGWAMGPFYPGEELAFTDAFELKDWDHTLVQQGWNSHIDNGPEYISVTRGSLTVICGVLNSHEQSPLERESFDVPAGFSVVLRPGLWRRFTCTPDATGISVRRPAHSRAHE